MRQARGDGALEVWQSVGLDALTVEKQRLAAKAPGGALGRGSHRKWRGRTLSLR
jgi:hypothetical protein